jgi:hypothetical protein
MLHFNCIGNTEAKNEDTFFVYPNAKMVKKPKILGPKPKAKKRSSPNSL